MTLEVEKYDTTKEINELRLDIRHRLGDPMYRMVRNEIETFLQNDVGAALKRAFSDAEAIYVFRIFDNSEASSRTLLEGVMAGIELGKQAASKKKG